MLRLVPESVHDLVNPERQVPVRPNPDLKHGVNRGLRSGAECERDLQLRAASLRYPKNLLLKPFYVLLLLQQLVLGNQKREQHLLVLLVQERPQNPVNQIPQFVAVRKPHVRPLHRVPHVQNLRPLQDLAVPLTEIAFAFHFLLALESRWWDLNPRSADYESAALPLSHSGVTFRD